MRHSPRFPGTGVRAGKLDSELFAPAWAEARCAVRFRGRNLLVTGVSLTVVGSEKATLLLGCVTLRASRALGSGELGRAAGPGLRARRDSPSYFETFSPGVGVRAGRLGSELSAPAWAEGRSAVRFRGRYLLLLGDCAGRRPPKKSFRVHKKNKK